MNKSLIQSVSLCFIALLFRPYGAGAQTVDYGAFQSLYGEPITTSATGTPLRASESPADVTIITADEIRQSGSRQIPEILGRVPGLDILQSGLNVFDVGVRGYQQPFQPRLLVLVDGRQVFLDDYSRTAWDNIPVNVDDIRQIEVVNGASSALYGSNAAGGVINIVTYSPLYDNNSVASFAVGTQNTVTGDGTKTFRGDWGGTKFSIGGLNASEFDTSRYPLDQRAAAPTHRYVSNSSVFHVSPTIQAFTEATLSDSVGNTADPTDNFLVGKEKTTTYSLRGGGTWQSSIGMLTSDTFFNHSYVSLDEPTDGGAPYAFVTDLIDSKLEDKFELGTAHTIRLGLEYKHKNFKMSGAQIIQPAAPALGEDNYGVSGTWLWNIDERWSWTNAMRYDHLSMEETGTLMVDSHNNYNEYSHSLNALSANSALVYKASELDSLRFGYGRGVQLPSLINSGYGLLQNFGSLVSDWEGNPNLKPTIVQDYSFDYMRKVPEVFSFVKVGPFYEINQEVVSPLLQTGTVTVSGNTIAFGESVNVGNSKAYGGEIQIKGSHLNGMRWDASYSFTRVIDSEGVANNGVNYQGSAPQHHWRLFLGYTTGAWEFDGGAQFVTATDMLRSMDGGATFAAVHTKPYATVNARIGYQIDPTFTVAVSGRNLNRGELVTSPYPAVERQGLLMLTGKF